MPITKGHLDPRSRAERRADEEVLAKFEAGKFLSFPPDRVAAAIRHVEQAYASRTEGVTNRPRWAGLIHDAVFDRFPAPIDCLETVDE
ncbi:MAG TPA: hypothetical protein VMW56_15505 [Candidatus Margulisiibacteriota bacterium]|nr:hypothetical protein [Candidatus Margulisiibacteriota bacterium]